MQPGFFTRVALSAKRPTRLPVLTRRTSPVTHSPKSAFDHSHSLASTPRGFYEGVKDNLLFFWSPSISSAQAATSSRHKSKEALLGGADTTLDLLEHSFACLDLPGHGIDEEKDLGPSQDKFMTDVLESLSLTELDEMEDEPYPPPAALSPAENPAEEVDYEDECKTAWGPTRQWSGDHERNSGGEAPYIQGRIRLQRPQDCMEQDMWSMITSAEEWEAAERAAARRLVELLEDVWEVPNATEEQESAVLDAGLPRAVAAELLGLGEKARPSGCVAPHELLPRWSFSPGQACDQSASEPEMRISIVSDTVTEDKTQRTRPGLAWLRRRGVV